MEVRPPCSDAAAGQSLLNETQRVAALQAKHRKDASDWLARDPYPKLLLMKLVVAPLTHCLLQQLGTSSSDTEKAQRAQLATAMLSGSWDGVKARTYPLVVAASLEVEKKFFGDIETLILHDSAATWNLFPDHCKTNDFRSLAHRLIARAGASVFELLQRPHMAYPIKLSRLLHVPELASIFASEPSCMKDGWSLSLQGMFPTFEGGAFMSVLQAQAQCQRTNISSLESRHASVRRHLHGRSLQTHTLGIAAASTEWVLQNCRTVLPKTKKQKVRNVQVMLGDHVAKPRKSAKGAGGPWRAFLRLHAAGSYGKPDQRAMAVMYHTIKSEAGYQWELLRKLGKAGTLAKATGTKKSGGLGLSQKQCQRVAAKQSLQNLVQAAAGQSIHDRAQMVLKHCSIESTSPAYSLHIANACARLEGQLHKEQHLADELQTLLARMPMLKGMELHPVPGG
eukprot:6486014-Amphidinium_carterae.4